jgi:hypothetical protein
MSNFLTQFKGKTFNFYGVWNNCFKLNDVVFEAIEDPDDGYRSFLDCVKVIKEQTQIFSPLPLCEVTIEENVFLQDGFNLVEVNSNRPILTVGTDYEDTYYPCFVFDNNIVDVLNPTKIEPLEEKHPLADLQILLD